VKLLQEGLVEAKPPLALVAAACSSGTCFWEKSFTQSSALDFSLGRNFGIALKGFAFNKKIINLKKQKN
jgi:hypothetical protein